MVRPRLVITALLIASTLTACASEPAPYASADCDRGDLAEYDTDCGYWDADGTFVTWWWVTTSGGYRPAGFVAKRPYNSSVIRPHNAKLTTPKRQAPPPGVNVNKPPAKSNTSGSRSSSVRGGRR